MNILELLELLVWATCKALKVFGEIFGYWLGVVCIAAIWWELTDTLMTVTAIIAFAWFFVSRLLVYWME